MRKILFNKNGDVRYLILLNVVTFIAFFYAKVAAYFEAKTTTLSNASGFILSMTVILIVIQFMIYLFFLLTKVNDYLSKVHFTAFYSYRLDVRYDEQELCYEPFLNKKIEGKTYLTLNIIRC